MSPWSSRCPRCAAVTALDDGVAGCSPCAAEGVGMPMVPFRTAPAELRRPGPAPAGLGPMWRWRDHLLPVADPVSLGEGGTPLLRVAGLPGRVHLKDERVNPTGSFKDRLAGAVVSRAREQGADTVVVSSSGNAGVAVAAYAAAAGLRCVLLGTRALPAAMASVSLALGARVLLLPTHADRWSAARTGVAKLGWFPVTNHLTPPVASHPAGVQAYRTIAFEIAEQLDWRPPDWMAVPVSRGDALFGLYTGFAELRSLGWTSTVPRMLAVERLPSLTSALASGTDQPPTQAMPEAVKAFSIGDPQATAMALHAVRASGGRALTCTDDDLLGAQQRLAARGVLAELSSAAALLGAEAVAADGVTVVGLLTARPSPFDFPPSGADCPSSPSGATPEYLTDPTDVAALSGLPQEQEPLAGAPIPARDRS
ncbi:pyridoxal-phosphate dependent enzyme [Actinoplanes sp. NPDC051851]|uniref:pyridoxal-phosphate dependent enzyme n=1 Tax=Actinoplanes sp. NPDC051851 TaxID=3154753 RepID=UPI00342A26CC